LQNTTQQGGKRRYDDWNSVSPDEEHENQKVHNPQIGLAFIKRVISALSSIGKAIDMPVPPYADDILSNLAPFNTAKLNPLDPHRCYAKKKVLLYTFTSISPICNTAMHTRVFPHQYYSMDCSRGLSSRKE
jgi:hypothetical protein